MASIATLSGQFIKVGTTFELSRYLVGEASMGLLEQ